MAEEQKNELYEQWLYSAVDDNYKVDDKPLPVLTVLMYKICEENLMRFSLAEDMLRRAFEAGQAACK